MELWQPIRDFLVERSGSLFRVAIVIGLAVLVSRGVLRWIERGLTARLQSTQITVGRVLIGYMVYGIAFVWSLQILGFDPGVLLGAAGLVTVAVGFASQTSVSNIISGLFLIVERPFTVGDVVRVEDVTGVVLSVDLLSVKLRTFDNLYVRMPNESMLKSRVTTLTKFPVRRIDSPMSLSHRSDLDKVESVLMEVADRDPQCLEEPQPQYFFLRFAESSLDVQFSVWVRREDFLMVRNRIRKSIIEAFRKNDIKFAFPQRVLHYESPAAPLAEPPATETTPPDDG